MRLFFGFGVHAPWHEAWPRETFPQGRLLSPEARHITLAFLGDVDEHKLIPFLPQIPHPSRVLGWSGQFTEVDFYPHRHPHVAAWNMRWQFDEQALFRYQQELKSWLNAQGFKLREGHPFNPHVTLCRAPFNKQEWEEAFSPLPFYTGSLHLYQSLGNSTYQPLWTLESRPPFVEIEHTADIAFQIFGQSLEELFGHAQLALAFKAPGFLDRLTPPFAVTTLDSVIKGLNGRIAQLDQREGIPFKAVSYHGEVETEGDLLKWEMIVDV